MNDDLNWDGFFQAIGTIATITDQRRVRMKSRDYFWYSPVLYRQLKNCTAHCLVRPGTEADVITVAEACARYSIPLTVRGGGTGNYGQAVPLAGGIILDITGLDRIIAIEKGVAHVAAGALIDHVAQTARATGQDLLMWPSTKRQATIGGFIAGGSAGIGSIRNGVLRDDGNVKSLRIVTLTDPAKIITLEGHDIQKAHHAYGTNGIITELKIALEPAVDWLNTIVLFENYEDTLRFGLAAQEQNISLYLFSSVDKRFAAHYANLAEFFPGTRHAVFAMVAPQDTGRFAACARDCGGTVSLSQTEPELAGAGLPPAWECAFNHTTLQVLKSGRDWTYLQIAYPEGFSTAIDETIHARFGDEVLRHHEFAREKDRLQVFAIPLVKWSTAERLYEIAGRYEQLGCTVFDAHDFTISGGGMKTVDQVQMAFKAIADPGGLMNPGKTSPEEARKIGFLPA